MKPLPLLSSLLLLAGCGPDVRVEVINAGVPGDTSEDVLTQDPWMPIVEARGKR